MWPESPNEEDKLLIKLLFFIITSMGIVSYAIWIAR